MRIYQSLVSLSSPTVRFSGIFPKKEEGIMKAHFINILRCQSIRTKWKHDIEDRAESKQRQGSCHRQRPLFPQWF